MTQHPTTTKEEANGLQKSHDWLIDYLHSICSLCLYPKQRTPETQPQEICLKNPIL
jgi:hypothetical protein